ncbi:MAG: cation transporter [Candidatus Omnitrophica bacterium]|nr:cation transporter [Candidatus Omnitrophota bacterium]
MHQHDNANHHKKNAALGSVCAAFGLVSLKIIVGLATGSLGLLAEAAHSGLDFAAAAVTFFAVRESAKPADHEHLYGHGKIESLSALFETLLLLITCFWIIHASVTRLISNRVEIEVNIFSYLVIITSIIVDVSRSRILYKVAKKYNSEALEADALHFSTDIWSSLVVLVGLVCVSLSSMIKGADFLRYADAIAALMVAGIVVTICWDLGSRTIGSLLDRAPAGLKEKIIARVEQIPGVYNCHRLRIRTSGPQIFIDLPFTMDRSQPLQQAQRLKQPFTPWQPIPT